jgi:ABC-type proline/glycine betaine transport system ATPase subunit
MDASAVHLRNWQLFLSVSESAFEPGKINIIHGLSGTGKSSIVHIID